MSRLFTVIACDQQDYKVVYSGDRATAEFMTVMYGLWEEDGIKSPWALYKRCPSRQFGNHVNRARKWYRSLDEVEAAIAELLAAREVTA